ELDIELAIDNFIAQLFDERFHSMLTVAEKCRTAAGKDIADEKAIKQAITFSTLYDQLELEVINSFEFNIDEQDGKASVSFHISYVASTDREATHFEGKAEVQGSEFYWVYVGMNVWLNGCTAVARMIMVLFASTRVLFFTPYP